MSSQSPECDDLNWRLDFGDHLHIPEIISGNGTIGKKLKKRTFSPRVTVTEIDHSEGVRRASLLMLHAMKTMHEPKREPMVRPGRISTHSLSAELMTTGVAYFEKEIELIKDSGISSEELKLVESGFNKAFQALPEALKKDGEIHHDFITECFDGNETWSETFMMSLAEFSEGAREDGMTKTLDKLNDYLDDIGE